MSNHMPIRPHAARDTEDGYRWLHRAAQWRASITVRPRRDGGHVARRVQ